MDSPVAEKDRPSIRVEARPVVFGRGARQAPETGRADRTKAGVKRATGAAVAAYGASFEIERGGLFAIIGHSGSGKSTGLRASIASTNLRRGSKGRLEGSAVPIDDASAHGDFPARPGARALALGEAASGDAGEGRQVMVGGVFVVPSSWRRVACRSCKPKVGVGV